MTSTPDQSIPALQDVVAGDVIILDIGSPAHGGHCVARWQGRVIFVRHAITGERVRAKITDTSSKTFWRADAIEILQASPERVTDSDGTVRWWPAVSPGGAGGAELAHVSVAGQQRWKTAVLQEQFERLAGLSIAAEVRAVSHDDAAATTPPGWRTRISLIADDQGRAGMRRHHSHDIVPLTSMPLATPRLQELLEAESVFSFHWRPGTVIEGIDPSADEPRLLVDGKPWRRGRLDKRNISARVREAVQTDRDEFTYRVNAQGFWQVHAQAPRVLVRAVLDALGGFGDPTGLRIVDLYSGAGLFTVPLAAAVGPTGRVLAVESGSSAIKDARRNLATYSQVALEHNKVHTSFRHGALSQIGRVDAVVLDPPRTGAGREVVDAIGRIQPSAVVYVACDPAALARDVSYFGKQGYQLQDLNAYDLFPSTHHMESVALLVRSV